jgi:hypothetical protein
MIRCFIFFFRFIDSDLREDLREDVDDTVEVAPSPPPTRLEYCDDALDIVDLVED